jgi:hypothetical protein
MSPPFVRITHNGKDFPQSPRHKAPREALAIGWRRQGDDHVASVGSVLFGRVTKAPAGERLPFLWVVFHHLAPRAPQPAATIEKAKGAVEHSIEGFFDACHHPLRASHV